MSEETNVLHAEVASLKKGLESNEQSIKNLSELLNSRFAEMNEDIQNLNNNQSNNGGKQTGLISLFIAALAAVAAPIGVTLSFQQNALSSHMRDAKEARENMRIDYVERDNRIINQQDTLTDRVDDMQQKLDSHVGMAEQKFESDDARIAALETTIHQEIESVQSLLDERISNLDTVLQREMRLLDETSNTKVGNLEREIENLRTRLRNLEMMAKGIKNNRDK